MKGTVLLSLKQRTITARKSLRSSPISSIAGRLAGYTSLDTAARLQLCQSSLGNFTPNDLIKHLNTTSGGLSTALHLKEDVAAILKSGNLKDKESIDAAKQLEGSLKNWLATVFCVDCVDLKTIEFETASGAILEKVAKGEAVHRVRSLSELKRRLANGRQCFALFHKSMPVDPVAFLHVAFTKEIAPSLRFLDSSCVVAQPTHAMFYSVNSPHPALSGLDLATRVIKSAGDQLKLTHPTIKTLSTLSPIPGFMNWFRGLTKPEGNDRKVKMLILMPTAHRMALQKLSQASSIDNAILWLANTLSEELPVWTRDQALCAALKEPILWLGAYYIFVEKVPQRAGEPLSLPLDNVARFHLRNGACFHRINWMGNDHSNGLATSAGLMVNYVYSSSSRDTGESFCPEITTLSLEQRAERFQQTNGEILLGPSVKEILMLPQ